MPSAKFFNFTQDILIDRFPRKHKLEHVETNTLQRDNVSPHFVVLHLLLMRRDNLTATA